VELIDKSSTFFLKSLGDKEWLRNFLKY
jgi:hypothetical protein